MDEETRSCLGVRNGADGLATTFRSHRYLTRSGFTPGPPRAGHAECVSGERIGMVPRAVIIRGNSFRKGEPEAGGRYLHRKDSASAQAGRCALGTRRL